MIMVTTIVNVVHQTNAIPARHARKGMVGVIVNDSEGARWLDLDEARHLRNRLNAAISEIVKHEAHDARP